MFAAQTNAVCRSSATHPHQYFSQFHIPHLAFVYRCGHGVTLVSLLKVGHSAAKIHTFLRSLKVNEHHVYHVKKLFEEIGDFHDCPQAGQPRSTCMKNVMNLVYTQIT